MLYSILRSGMLGGDPPVVREGLIQAICHHCDVETPKPDLDCRERKVLGPRQFLCHHSGRVARQRWDLEIGDNPIGYRAHYVARPLVPSKRHVRPRELPTRTDRATSHRPPLDPWVDKRDDHKMKAATTASGVRPLSSKTW